MEDTGTCKLKTNFVSDNINSLNFLSCHPSKFRLTSNSHFRRKSSKATFRQRRIRPDSLEFSGPAKCYKDISVSRSSYTNAYHRETKCKSK